MKKYLLSFLTLVFFPLPALAITYDFTDSSLVIPGGGVLGFENVDGLNTLPLVVQGYTSDGSVGNLTVNSCSVVPCGLGVANLSPVGTALDRTIDSGEGIFITGLNGGTEDLAGAFDRNYGSLSLVFDSFAVPFGPSTPVVSVFVRGPTNYSVVYTAAQVSGENREVILPVPFGTFQIGSISMNSYGLGGSSGSDPFSGFSLREVSGATVIPLPSTLWLGLACIGAFGLLGLRSKRRSLTS